MKQNMTWRFTLMQWHVMDNLIKYAMQGLKENTALCEERLLFMSILGEVQTTLVVGIQLQRVNPHKQKKFKLTYHQCLVFYRLFWELVLSDRMDIASLEFVLVHEMCRDIHQKLLT